MIQKLISKKPMHQLFLALFISITIITISHKIYRTEMIRDTFLALHADSKTKKIYQDLLLGSSTIKHLVPTRDLTCGNWLKRGIGNSQISDLLRYLKYSPLNIKPEKILIYAGENDLANDINSAQVMIYYKQLLTTLHDRYPLAELHLLSIKPSPKRADLHQEINALNNQLKDYSQRKTYLFFHDTDWKNHGAAYRKLFKPDGVHLSAHGYSLLTKSFNKHCKTETLPN